MWSPTDLVTPEGHKMARESLQLLLTLLPPGCRRQLQLLLRFMYKAAANQRLQLSEVTPGRELVSGLMTVVMVYRSLVLLLCLCGRLY